MKRVVLHSRAAGEIEDAVSYYNGARDGLGDEFRTEIEERITLIGRRPKACSPYPGGYRKSVLGGRFPYSIFYVEYDDHVWVATVYHASREPDAWKDRTPE